MNASHPVPTVAISPVEAIVDDMRAGRMVILVDEEDRENEGDLVLAADHVTPEAINFMARFGRGLICLTLTRERCERLRLPPMVARNGTKHGDGLHRVDRGRRRRDHRHLGRRPRPHGAGGRGPQRPGPTTWCSPATSFRCRRSDGGVLMRAGHTEAGCDLAGHGRAARPAAVICEIMKDDGTMARLPDLQLFAAEHGLKIGTIADLIEHRSRNESLIEKVGARAAADRLSANSWPTRGRTSPARACTWRWCKGQWSPGDTVPVRVHEPLSVLDALEINRSMHSWNLDASLRAHRPAGPGRGGAAQLRRRARSSCWRSSKARPRPSHAPERGRMDLRTYGVGAQILRECGVHRMDLMGNPRRMPSMAGYGLEIVSHVAPH